MAQRSNSVTWNGLSTIREKSGCIFPKMSLLREGNLGPNLGPRAVPIPEFRVVFGCLPRLVPSPGAGGALPTGVREDKEGHPSLVCPESKPPSPAVLPCCREDNQCVWSLGAGVGQPGAHQLAQAPGAAQLHSAPLHSDRSQPPTPTASASHAPTRPEEKQGYLHYTNSGFSERTK